MARRRTLPLIAGIGIGTIAATVMLRPGIAWAPPAEGTAAAPVREQNLDGTGSIKVHEQGTANVRVVNGDGRGHLYSTAVDVRTDEPQGCNTVTLPAGDFVIEHAHAWFVIPVDTYLRIPTAVEIDLPDGTTTVGRSGTIIRLTSAPQNLADQTGWVSELHTAVRVNDGFAPVAGRMYRDPSNPIEFCARDNDADRGSSGDAAVSGYVVR